MTDEEKEQLTAALEPFGWTLTPEFLAEYMRNVWVYNLANALVAVRVENERLQSLNDSYKQTAELISAENELRRSQGLAEQYERAQEAISQRDEALAHLAAERALIDVLAKALDAQDSDILNDDYKIRLREDAWLQIGRLGRWTDVLLR